MNALCLAIDIFPDKAGKKTFLLLHLGEYLFTVVHGNRYLPKDSKEYVISITIVGNVSYSR